ncbi:hypothetical protein ACEXQE_13875 [Herbiconiux sp. P17]|uniref:hypothetical protein n=1 Tax=Herbiconiux wuyangfengii TaxID=3342794 RepID=UPI0035BB3C2A
MSLTALTPATAAPSGALRGPTDFVSVAVTGGNPDFGYVKAGVALTRTISFQNDGLDGWSMDPAPLAALAAPFTLVSTTLIAGQEVEPGQTRSITLKYTAPAAGTVSNQTVNLKAVDFDNPGSLNFALEFKGHSLDTDRSYFEVTTAAGAGTVDFGTVKVGETAKVSMKILVRGIDPMKFTDGQISVLNSSGMPVPGVTVSQSSFGTGGVTYRPGQTATCELSFTPATAGTILGTLTVSGKQMSGDPEAKDFVATLSVRAVAVTPSSPTPTPTPTSTPTPTPTTTQTPNPTPTATVPGGSGGGGSLASTGAEQVTGLGLGALAVFGCGIAMILVRRFTRSRG